MSYTPIRLLSYSSLSWGGCLPMRYNTWRILTRPVRFIFNASTVARPVGVKPIICAWSSLQQKCSCHLYRRGLYNGTMVLSVVIRCFRPVVLMPVTSRTRKGQIVEFTCSTSADRHDIFDRKRFRCIISTTLTVLATALCTLNHCSLRNDGDVDSRHTWHGVCLVVLLRYRRTHPVIALGQSSAASARRPPAQYGQLMSAILHVPGVLSSRRVIWP